jgi:hypothetical protein
MKIILSILVSICLVSCLKPVEVVEIEKPFDIPRPPNRPLPPIPEPPTPDFITIQSAEELMLIDAQTLPSDNARLEAFYLYACDMYNAGKTLGEIKKAADKLINSVSTAAFISRLVPIGPAGVECIFRGDQSDYNLNNFKYRSIENAMLLDFRPESIRAQNLAFLLQKRKPYLYLSDLATTVLQADQLSSSGGLCDLYCLLTEQAADVDDFFAQQGIDVDDAAADEEVYLAATNRSPIALGKGRIVQIIESNFGWCMSSFDSSLAQQDSINVNPFPIAIANAGGVIQSAKVFKDIAQEHLCTMPNGMYISRLNGNDGLAASEAPGNIVSNPDDRFHDGIIRLGGCPLCHATIGKAVTDEALAIIRGNPAFDANEKLLGEVFYNTTTFQGNLGDINRAYARALQEVGITDQTVDPINKELISWFREPYDVVKAASFTGLDVPDFLERLRGTAISSVALGNLFNGGTVSIIKPFQGPGYWRVLK